MLPVLNRFHVYLVDHCNLNCIGCGHYSPLSDEKYLDINIFENDIKRISKLLTVNKISFMGGEPLLHPKINDFLCIARKYFPLSILQILTNGILLLKQKDDFWKCLKDNYISILQTKYPINLDFEKIRKKSSENNVEFDYFINYMGNLLDPKTMHKVPFDLEGKQDPVYSCNNCMFHCTCIVLENGVMYPCPVVPSIKIFNKFFNKTLEVSNMDGIDIHSVNNGLDIIKFLNRSIPFCKYCQPTKIIQEIPWSASKREISEWV